MRRIFIGLTLLVGLMLVGCNLAVPTIGGQPTLVGVGKATDVQMQTQISQMLTNIPTNTVMPDVATATPNAPDVVVENPTATEAQALDTATPADATNTPAAVAATATPQAATSTPTQATATQAAATAMPTSAATINPAFTPAAGDPRSRLGKPAATDPMNEDKSWLWPVGSDTFTTGEFKDGNLILTTLTDQEGWRLANPKGSDFGNVYVEATFHTQTCSGLDHYGIIARSPVLADANQGYLFAFSCDGHYFVRSWDAKAAPKGVMKDLVAWNTNSAIAAGSNQTNVMGVMLVGKRLLLYANGKLIADVQDATFDKGYFGVMAGSIQTKNFAIKVDEMSYWENPQP